jgi:hypothetical protein
MTAVGKFQEVMNASTLTTRRDRLRTYKHIQCKAAQRKRISKTMPNTSCHRARGVLLAPTHPSSSKAITAASAISASPQAAADPSTQLYG